MTAIKNRGALAFSVASALFFLSGGTGLAYQVIWSKRFSHVWGNSTLAMAAVVASFLFGLGLGAHVLGRVADRARSCLFWYGVSEAAIGILALAIPFEILALRPISAGLYPLLAGHPALHSLVRFVLTFLVIGPACVLMGGTLPLLIKHFTPPDSAPRASAGWLYAINTLGAAAGTYLAGFHLLPSFGLFSTNVGVALLNFCISFVAVLLALPIRAAQAGLSPAPTAATVPAAAGSSPPPLPHSQRTGQPSPAKPPTGSLYLTVVLTGCASLLLEMVWTRQLAVILGSSTYAFSAMLFLLLVGIGLGSLLFHVRFRKSGDLALVPAITIAGIGVTTCAGKLLIPQVSILVGTLKDLRASQGWNAVIATGASAVLELLPAIGMGLLFPIFIDRTRKRAADAGKAIGAIYAWNTAGSIAGATAAFILLVPAVGLSNTEQLALVLYTAALLLVFPFPRRARDAVTLAVLCVVLSLSGYLTGLEVDPRDTDLGCYMYGHTGNERTRYEVSYFREGASSNVLVTRQGKDFSLRVNGKVDASSLHDMDMQLGLAYFPIFLSPGARDVCIIGFGSGTTPGAALLFPEVHVTCCEIEPAVFEASRHFAAVNHSPESSPRFSVVFDDGRSHLQGTNKKYDLILSEPSNPWIAGVSNLFTREFYEAARDRLAPGGILAQWIQVYSFSAADYALVARTLLDVFPECGLIRISGGDTILLASSAPIGGTRETFDRAQALVTALPPVQADLKKAYGSGDVRGLLLSRLLLDTAGVRTFIEADGSGALNTDLNLKLEFDAPLRLFEKDTTTAAVARKLYAGARTEWFAKAAAQWGCSKEQAGVFHEITRLFDRTSQKDLLRGLAEVGLALDPDRPELLVNKLAIDPPQDPAAFTRAVDHALGLSKKEANRLGVTFFKGASFERAVQVFHRILAIHPEAATAWNNLAVAYEAWGKLADAENAFQKSLSIDPVNAETRKSYDAFQQKHAKRDGGEPGTGAQGTATPESAPSAEETKGTEEN